MGEAINLVENFKVEKVIFNCGDFNEFEQELIDVLDITDLYRRIEIKSLQDKKTFLP